MIFIGIQNEKETVQQTKKRCLDIDGILFFIFYIGNEQ
jgi:hypothetical protein